MRSGALATRISVLLAAEALRDVPTAAGHGRNAARPAPTAVAWRRMSWSCPSCARAWACSTPSSTSCRRRASATSACSATNARPWRRSTTRSCPIASTRAYVLMIDPMLATGGSASAALDLLRRAGAPASASSASSPRRKASPSSSATIPTSSIYTPVVDSHLNAQKYIVPGLGDFGDRLYGTRLRACPRLDDARWQTSLTSIEPNKILVRGYPLDEMMGRLSFAESAYLLLMGELPPPAIGRMFARSSSPRSITASRRPRRSPPATWRRPARRSKTPSRPACSRSGRTTAAISSRACGISIPGWR